MTRKWRPSLWFVLGGALGWTLILSLLGMVALRYLGPEIGFKNAAFLLAGAICLATTVIWLLLLRLLLRPVSALSRYAANVQANPADHVTRPEQFGTRELHRMGQSVIEMAQVLSRREQTVRNFTDHVIHEVKTPVTAVQAATELLDDSPDLTPADRKLVGQIRGAGKQMQAQLAALRETVMAREADYQGQTLLVSLFDRLVADHPDLDISVDGGAIAVPLNRDGLMIVLGHLIRNAVAHGATEVRLTLQNTDGVTLLVQDNGTGVSEGNRSRIFDPFFTSRRDSGGTGMGLYIVETLLQGNGAEIELMPAKAGAAFKIRFSA